MAAESQGEIVAAAVASGVARVDPRAKIRPHASAVLAVDVERLHFFDPATGTAIRQPARRARSPPMGAEPPLCTAP